MKDLKPILLALGAEEDIHCMAWHWPRQEWVSMTGEGDFNPCLEKEIQLALIEDGYTNFWITKESVGWKVECWKVNGNSIGLPRVTVEATTIHEGFVQLYAKYKNIKEDGE